MPYIRAHEKRDTDNEKEELGVKSSDERLSLPPLSPSLESCFVNELLCPFKLGLFAQCHMGAMKSPCVY